MSMLADIGSPVSHCVIGSPVSHCVSAATYISGTSAVKRDSRNYNAKKQRLLGSLWEPHHGLFLDHLYYFSHPDLLPTSIIHFLSCVLHHSPLVMQGMGDRKEKTSPEPEHVCCKGPCVSFGVSFEGPACQGLHYRGCTTGRAGVEIYSFIYTYGQQ